MTARCRRASAAIGDTESVTIALCDVARAGTTALYNFLRSHPRIYISPIKEPIYFCEERKCARVPGGTRRKRISLGCVAQQASGLGCTVICRTQARWRLFSRARPGFKPTASFVASKDSATPLSNPRTPNRGFSDRLRRNFSLPHTVVTETCAAFHLRWQRQSQSFAACS